MECWSTSSLGDDDVIKNLFQSLNPPRVTMDNESNKKATVIKVDSMNKRGCLLNVVQVLTNLKLIIKKAYISSDGGWFLDVFHVTDELGNKVYEDNISEQILQSLSPKERRIESMDKFLSLQPLIEHTTIELSGTDRPGLLSEIFAVLTDHKCNVLAADIWTHNSRMASVVHIIYELNALPIDNPYKLNNIMKHLLYVLKGNRDKKGAKTTIGVDSTQTERRLHQIMYDDRDYDSDKLDCEANERCKLLITVEDCVEKNYTVLSVSCLDRPKLVFDTVCTITDMHYVIFHGSIIAEGPVAQQEYFIRHMDGGSISSELEKERVIYCLEAAIKRRSCEGIRLELCSDNRVGLLADVTRIFRENGLTVKRAEVATKGAQAVNVFYVADTSGYPVKCETIEAIKKEIGLNVVHVKDETLFSSPPQQTPLLSLGSFFRSRSEKFLYKLGVINSRPSEAC